MIDLEGRGSPLSELSHRHGVLEMPEPTKWFLGARDPLRDEPAPVAPRCIASLPELNEAAKLHHVGLAITHSPADAEPRNVRVSDP